MRIIYLLIILFIGANAQARPVEQIYVDLATALFGKAITQPP